MRTRHLLTFTKVATPRASLLALMPRSRWLPYVASSTRHSISELCGLALALAVVLALVAGRAEAETYRWAGTELNAMRRVSNVVDKPYTVIVTEFFHHGEINDKGTNVVVVAANKEIVPARLLQLGPGDFCRLAFQTAKGQKNYEIYYGGEPPTEALPEWTNRDGLLLETHHYKDCDLNSLDSVREAFKTSKPYGADYVENVGHSFNPFNPAPDPFLTRYSGYLDIRATATYGFLTSSRDASFLLIDDKEVISAPGQHGPMYHAKRGSRRDIRLDAGRHKFEYYHAAAGPEAIMVAAWEVSPTEDKPKPVAIPGELFRTRSIGKLPSSNVLLRTSKAAPDFLVKVAGDVPLPDNEEPLLAVLFRNTTPSALTSKARVQWNFGDGQISDKLDTDHVYLHPGVYPVSLSVKRGPRVITTTNRILIERPFTSSREKEESLHTLDDYLPILRSYNPSTLDAASLRQLVTAFEAKAMLLVNAAEEAAKQAVEAEEAAEAALADPNRRTDTQPNADPNRRGAPNRRMPAQPPVDPRAAHTAGQPPQANQPADPNKQPPAPRFGSQSGAPPLAQPDDPMEYIRLAVAAGKAPFVGQSAAKGDEDLYKLAQIIGPMARHRLGDSELAYQVWFGAVRKISTVDYRTDAALEAADIAINDLLNVAAAKTLLDGATKLFGENNAGPIAAKLRRVWGDYYAATGKGEEARKAYREAEAILGNTKAYQERTAWQGAHSRSTEEFIKKVQPDRAAAEIAFWQRDFPTEKIDGYLTLMFARYWALREKYDQAIGQAEQLQTVNPESPYVDQMLLLAAQCEVKRGKVDRALATLHGLLKDYPGSPLVPVVKQNIAKWEAGEFEEEKPKRRRLSR